MNYTPIIGLEIHIELATKSGMFCRCSADHFGAKPNENVCPVCLGLPGALPYPNKKAIEDTVKVGLALDCTINEFSKFDRKNYFYPDLPKAYQISQYDMPFCQNGKLKIHTSNLKDVEIGITRVHLEEDTGKMRHDTVDGQDVSLIDFNRSGVPLVEIVTEPEFRNAEDPVIFAKKLRQIVRYLGVSECDMEKGSMRLEANVSVGKLENPAAKIQKLPNYKVELKNINSFRFMQKAIEIEIKRQTVILSSGGELISETRGYNEDKNTTFAQRSKEEAKDYRYFPDPDLPPVIFDKVLISKIKTEIPELPDAKKVRFIKDYSIPEHYLDKILEDIDKAKMFEDVLKLAIEKNIELKTVINAIVNKGVDITKVDKNKFITDLSSEKLDKISDINEIKKYCEMVLLEFPDASKDYKNGKVTAISSLIGGVMKKTSGKADPIVTKTLLIELLKA